MVFLVLIFDVFLMGFEGFLMGFLVSVSFWFEGQVTWGSLLIIQKADTFKSGDF